MQLWEYCYDGVIAGVVKVVVDKTLGGEGVTINTPALLRNLMF